MVERYDVAMFPFGRGFHHVGLFGPDCCWEHHGGVAGR